VEVDELAKGLWRWTSRVGGDDIASFYAELPSAVVLIDPIVPPEDRDRFLDALDRDVSRHGGPVVVVLSSEAMREAAIELVERYGATVF
jgi:hypothetical protein